VVGPAAEARSYRVLEDVPDRGAEMLLVADDEGCVAVAEEVAGAFVALVERLGVTAVQVAQPDGEQVLVRLQDQVVVVGIRQNAWQSQSVRRVTRASSTRKRRRSSSSREIATRSTPRVVTWKIARSGRWQRGSRGTWRT
jgi:hypothetical protein